MDPALLAHVQENPATMAALDTLANRYGQDIRTAMMAPSSCEQLGVPDTTMVVAYKDTGRILGFIAPNGHITLAPEPE